MKIILIITILILAGLGGGYFYLSQKPLQINIQLQPAPAPSGVQTLSTLTPSVGKDITINNCKGDPQILQVKDGTEVTFFNADNKEHAIFIAGANVEVGLPSGGLTKFTARRPSSVPANLDFTDNYICDSIPFSGGAIYIPAQ